MATEVSGKSLHQFYSFLRANCEELIFPKYDGFDGLDGIALQEAAPHEVYYHSFVLGVKTKSAEECADNLPALFQALRTEVSKHLACHQIIVRSKPAVRMEALVDPPGGNRVVLHTRLGFSGTADLVGQWRIIA